MDVLIVIGAILLIIYVIKNSKKKNHLKKKKDTINITVTSTSHNSNNKIEYSNANTKYVNKGIKRNSIAGMSYRNLKKRHAGYFTGYAILEKNKHDPYAIAIYNSKGKQLGYLPGGNKKRHDIIKSHPDNMIFVWGKVNHNPKTNNFWGHVYTPIGLSEDEINTFINDSAEALLSNINLAVN